MLHGTERIVKHKLGLLNLAEELSNVSRACKIMGVFRDTFYRYKATVDNGGIKALINKNRRNPTSKNRIEESIEAAVLAYNHINTAAPFLYPLAATLGHRAPDTAIFSAEICRP